MYSNTTNGPADHAASHAGFKPAANVSRQRHNHRLSIVVLAVLAVAVLASAAVLPLDDGANHNSQSAAWNLSHGQALGWSVGG